MKENREKKLIVNGKELNQGKVKKLWNSMEIVSLT